MLETMDTVLSTRIDGADEKDIQLRTNGVLRPVTRQIGNSIADIKDWFTTRSKDGVTVVPTECPSNLNHIKQTLLQHLNRQPGNFLFRGNLVTGTKIAGLDEYTELPKPLLVLMDSLVLAMDLDVEAVPSNVICDVLLAVCNQPVFVFTLVSGDPEANEVRKYNTSLAREVTDKLKLFMDERMCVVSGVCSSRDIEKPETFEAALKEHARISSFFIPSKTFETPLAKFNCILTAFWASVSNTNSVKMKNENKNIKRFLTKDQCVLLVENIHKKEVVVQHKPGSGATTLMLEVARRLSLLADTLLVCSTRQEKERLSIVNPKISIRTSEELTDSDIKAAAHIVVEADGGILPMIKRHRCWKFHLNMAKTDIQQPTAVTVGGQVHVGPPPPKRETKIEDPPTEIKKRKLHINLTKTDIHQPTAVTVGGRVRVGLPTPPTTQPPPPPPALAPPPPPLKRETETGGPTTDLQKLKMPGDQTLEMAGAFTKKAKEFDYSLSMETVQQELTGAKEVHFNMTRTDIHEPATVTFGGDVCVGPPTTQKKKTETNVFATEGTTSASSSGHLTTHNLKTMTSSAGFETTVSSPVPSCSGLSSMYPVGGSVSTHTAEDMRQSSGDQTLEMAGALIKKANEFDYSLSMETVQQELTGAKEVHFNLTRTDIHQPAAVTFGGNVFVGPPTTQKKKTETYLQKLRSETKASLQAWTEGMVMTKATRTILNRIIKGKTCVTVTGCPGEGKTTAGYLALKHLHDRGREVFDVKTPEDYFKVKETKQSVIMLNDIFGALSYDRHSMKKWQSVLSDVLALSEHKQEDKEQSLGSLDKKRPGLTVILICRLSVLKEASEDMGPCKQFILGEDNVVNLTEAEHDFFERMKVWKYHADHYNVTIDNKIVSKVCNLNLSHGFPHCCRLFAAMYSKNNQLNMEHFFSQPLDFLNQSMEFLMKDSPTCSLLKEMLKNDGSLDLESIEDPDRQYQYSCKAQSLQDTYLTLNGRTIEFHHPSVYDSVAHVICEKIPSFVISHCSLSFLNERVRVKGLQQENTIHTHHTLLVDSSLTKLLLQRFQKEFKERNIAGFLCHSSFLDERFVSRFMESIFPSHKLLLNISDKHTKKSFIFLMTKSGSDKILRYIHQYVELTEEEQREALLGVCEHSSVSSLEFLLQRYKDINLEVTDSDDQTPLLISTQKRSQYIIRILLMRNVNVNKTDKKGKTPLLNVCQHGVDGDGSVVKLMLEKGADTTVTLQGSGDTPLHLACANGHIDIVSLLNNGANINTRNHAGDTCLHYACYNGHVDVVSFLLEKGVDISTTNSAGETPFHYTCGYGHVDVVSLLLEKGVDINTTNSAGNTPLHSAIYSGHDAVVSLLLENGADINTENSAGETPLHYACYNEHIDVVSLLLEKGVDINTTDSDGDTPLHSACFNGHVNVVSLLLHKGAYINTTDSAGDTPLHYACYYGHADVVSVLLEMGADINTINCTGNTPLNAAYLNGHVEVVSLLLDKGADINTTDSAGDTPLHYACNNGDVEVGSRLLNKGADINKKNNDDHTPLHLACYNGDVEVGSLLLEKGADINTTNSAGNTPLHLACYNGHFDVHLLLKNGADINTTNSVGDQPLSYACSNGHVDVVFFLLEKGADINTANIDGDQPLHYACYNGHVDVVSLLLKKGASINTTDSAGNTPLHKACYIGHVDVVSLLLEKGADINTTNSDGITPLHVACYNGHVDIVSFLLEKGADVNTSNIEGDQPLHYACYNGNVDVVSLLLEKGADINTTNSDGITSINTSDSAGNTPLHKVCYIGHVDVVSLLLEKGADINTTNSDGITPLHVACYNGHVDVVSKLLEKGANINTKDSSGNTSLHKSCYYGHIHVLSLLLEKGADVNIQDSAGHSPLHFASYYGHTDVASLLLKKGADINTKDSAGYTPLHYACYNEHGNVVSLLIEKGADVIKVLQVDESGGTLLT